MVLKIVVVGDKTDHGGCAIGGSPKHDVGGKPISHLGDEVNCPEKYPGCGPS